MGHPVRSFLLNLLAVVVAMTLGMMTLFPLWVRLVGGADPGSWLLRIETQSLVMAVTMALPVVVWLRIRRHRWRPVLELAGAIVAGFVVLFPFFWAGMLDPAQVMVGGHVLLGVFALGSMLLRRTDYIGRARRRPAPEPSPTGPAG